MFLGSSSTASATGPKLASTVWPRIIKSTGSDSIRLRAVLPANTAPGSYYLTAMVDAGRAVTELNETNNLRATSVPLVVTSQWDVTVGAVPLPDSLIKGSTLALSLPIRNQGTRTVPSGWIGRVYLSTDASFGSDDTYLGDFTFTSELRTNSVLTLPLSFASKVGNGTYRLIVIADANNDLGESAENNNIIASDKTVTFWERYVDLNVGISQLVPTAYSTANVGESIPITFSVHNLGTEVAPGGWDVRLFLSQNNVIWGSAEDPQDQQLAQFVESRPIPAGGSISTFISLPLPAGQSLGQWYIGVKIDTDNRVVEGGPYAGLSDAPGSRGGGNNEASRSLNVTGLPNLVAKPWLAPEVGYDPGVAPAFYMQVTVEGAGQAPTGWRGAFCLNGPLDGWIPQSVTRVLDCSPTQNMVASFVEYNRLGAGTVKRGVFFVIPWNLWPGRYAVRALVDADNVIPETNENDNLTTTAGFSVHSLFDLEPTAITWSPAPSAGSTSTYVVATFRNNGPATALPGVPKIPDVPPGWNLRVKLSPTPADKSTWVDAVILAGGTVQSVVSAGRRFPKASRLGVSAPGTSSSWCSIRTTGFLS